MSDGITWGELLAYLIFWEVCKAFAGAVLDRR